MSISITKGSEISILSSKDFKLRIYPNPLIADTVRLINNHKNIDIPIINTMYKHDKISDYIEVANDSISYIHELGDGNVTVLSYKNTSTMCLISCLVGSDYDVESFSIKGYTKEDLIIQPYQFKLKGYNLTISCPRLQSLSEVRNFVSELNIVCKRNVPIISKEYKDVEILVGTLTSENTILEYQCDVDTLISPMKRMPFTSNNEVIPRADMTTNAWWDGDGLPSNSEGASGDYYLQLSTGDIYKKVLNAWQRIGNIRGTKGEKGEQGEQGVRGAKGDPGERGAQGQQGQQGVQGKNGSMWYDGIGLPPVGLGVVNDYYINIETGDFYNKESYSHWERVGSFVPSIAHLEEAVANALQGYDDKIIEIDGLIVKKFAQIDLIIADKMTSVDNLMNGKIAEWEGVINGLTDPIFQAEVLEARTSLDGTTYSKLKDRLKADFDKKANKTDVYTKKEVYNKSETDIRFDQIVVGATQAAKTFVVPNSGQEPYVWVWDSILNRFKCNLSHNFGTKNIVVVVLNDTTEESVLAEYKITSNTTVEVRVLTNEAYRVIVLNGNASLAMIPAVIDDTKVTNNITWSSLKLDNEFKSIKSFINSLDMSAGRITYDNSSSGLTSTNVKDALDEVSEVLSAIQSSIGGLNSSLINIFNDFVDL